ncbi:hypothetical protein GCK32_015243 [Trichostrongylus colubriformis]|uniref:Uncharacterized protein n=1 Tax=Trichostrongylus colubriformis TaxID=6319 RepID=A0AAN8IQ89_TRICO
MGRVKRNNSSFFVTIYYHGFQVLQNDKVRAITWSESRPDLLAIQYFQHPTEFRSIEGGAENTGVGHLDVSLVPSWVSAAPVGTSFAKGGRMATHYREWDDAKQMWHYSVEVKKVCVKKLADGNLVDVLLLLFFFF